MLEDKKLGSIYAVLAFLFWGGISPIYFKQIASVDALEILLYRVLFSVVTLLPFLLIRKEFELFCKTIVDLKVLKYLFFSTLFASTNWLIFIWAISHNQIMEASLGYYINPLVNVLLGFLFFNERMSSYQKLAVFIAFFAVLYQLFAMGSIPLISLALAFTFGFYGMVRKKVNIGSIVGLLIEVLILLPFVILYLIYLYQSSTLALVSQNLYVVWMLTLSGLITVIPLLLFNGAATRMKLTTLGFYQYIGPSVAFLTAVFIYNEPLDFHKVITFVLIWIALIVFSLDGLIQKYKR